jgi:hypothetical protein
MRLINDPDQYQVKCIFVCSTFDSYFREVKSNFFVAFIIVALSVPLLFKSFVVVRYLVHFEYYAGVLCENKDVPMSNCNGQCVLKKELSAAENQKDKSQVPVNWIKHFSLSIFEVNSSEQNTGAYLIFLVSIYNSRYLCNYLFLPLTTIEEPPSVC